jgi:hypothetical protein
LFLHGRIGFRSGGVSQEALYGGAVAVGVGVFRIQADGGVEVIERLLKVALLEVDVAAGVQREGEVGAKSERGVEMGEGQIEVTGLEGGAGAGVVLVRGEGGC